ncbi:STAS domain-containing protein [Streptacidiphilus jiangxiensis]|uniref:STAS domain-containing protein n=1 Tax=Streptacidiphilus jiangxiensis TaxID=235985 RepID=A0A1H7NZM3_STRJI|nr:STAS domain-containing protein [Streptacidiphilus jiangxiensis]
MAGTPGREADQAPPVIELRVTGAEGVTLHLALAGEADHFSTAPLRAILARAVEDGYQALVLDTTALTFADSGFLSALTAWQRSGRPLHHHPSPAVTRLLHHLRAADR